MKRRATVLVVLVFGCAVLGSCLLRAWSEPVLAGPIGPSLVLPESVRDLGATLRAQDLRVPFTIRNVGSRRLVLNELDLECCCRDRVQSTLVIAPGKAGEVYVPLDTRLATGSVEKIASFTTNDPSQPRFQLTVRALVTVGERVLASPRDRTQASVLIQ